MSFRRISAFFSLFFLPALLSCGNVKVTFPESMTPLASSTLETAGTELGIVDPVLGGTSVAQSFFIPVQNPDNPTEPVQVSSVVLKLKKLGTFSNDSTYAVTLTLETHDSGHPSGTPVSSSATVSLRLTTLTAEPSAISFTFPSKVSLTPTTVYWIRLTANYPQSSTHLVKWMAHDETDTYTDGHAVYETDTPNQFSTTKIGGLRDLVFAIYK